MMIQCVKDIVCNPARFAAGSLLLRCFVASLLSVSLQVYASPPDDAGMEEKQNVMPNDEGNVAHAAKTGEETKSGAASLLPFSKLRRDPAPEELVRDTHYWISNENRLELFFDDVKDKGGVYIGVGTDQNYLLAAWSKPEVLVLMDFDQAVVDLHLVYRALFLTSSTREDFLHAWEKKNKVAIRKQISTFYQDDKRKRNKARWAFARARWAVERRMNRVRKHMSEVGQKTFFDDDEQFMFIKRLFEEGRVFAVRGDLTAKRALRSIAKAAKVANLSIGVLYLSNAEQYFAFDWMFRRNIKRLPLDDNSVVIRTNGMGSLKRVKGTYYHYNAQVGANFVTWLSMKKRRPKNVLQLLRYAEPDEVVGYSHLQLTPNEAKERRRERKRERTAEKKKKWREKRAARQAKKKSRKKSSRQREKGPSSKKKIQQETDS